jgi:hypothetical protein
VSIERDRVNPHHPARVIIRVIALTMLAAFTLPLWVGTSAEKNKQEKIVRWAKDYQLGLFSPDREEESQRTEMVRLHLR